MMKPPLSSSLAWLRAHWSILLLLLGTVLFLILRTSPTDGIDTMLALDAELGASQPIVLDFYSNL